MTVKHPPRPTAALSGFSLTDLDRPDDPKACSAVVEIFLKDGRQFSVLAATPSWFERSFRDLGLPYYFGPSILFVREITERLVKRAVAAMVDAGEETLCQHDTPRTTLPRVLAEFKARHF